MNVGILTFHSQLNYGGVLQAYALQHALLGMGHEVLVIDRWLKPDNGPLECGYNHYGLKQWVKWASRSLMGCGDFSHWLRHVRTKRFIHSQLTLTPYHFYSWSEISGRYSSSPTQGSNSAIDIIVVGSDQVWHGGDWGDPRPYLFEDAPLQLPDPGPHGSCHSCPSPFFAPHVRAIAYAASFGMRALPSGIDYASGFRRFAAISVREKEGIALVKDTGYPNPVEHVVDPTLLLPREDWFKFVPPSHKPRHLVCYFLSESVAEAIPLLERWAKQNDWRVTIVCDGYSKEFPKSLQVLFRRMSEVVLSLLGTHRVRVQAGYGPLEFVKAFACSDACITDSFHAVMFSSIYDLNVRFLRPHLEGRKAMFARIEEFAATSIKGNPFVDNLADAVQAIIHEPRVVFEREVIESCCAASRAWLTKNMV